MFKHMARVNMTTVPYKGSAPAITDLIGGQIQVMFTTVASAASLIEGGQLRALAVTTAERSPAFPQLPTVAETGLPGFEAETWYGLLAGKTYSADIRRYDGPHRRGQCAARNFKSSRGLRVRLWLRRRTDRGNAVPPPPGSPGEIKWDGENGA